MCRLGINASFPTDGSKFTIKLLSGQVAFSSTDEKRANYSAEVFRTVIVALIE